MSIEAMKQALDKFEHLWEIGIDAEYKVELLPEIQALRQAIEQAEKQEPFGYFQFDLCMDAWVQNRDNKKGVLFFTAPPLKREWVGLHLDDIPETYAGDKSFLNIARWAEAKLKEKNT
jgi:hypothetical protein